MTRHPEFDLHEHPANMPYCWQCDVCNGFFFFTAAVPTVCPYCTDEDDDE